jgi:hypothetical protein
VFGKSYYTAYEVKIDRYVPNMAEHDRTRPVAYVVMFGQPYVVKRRSLLWLSAPNGYRG